MTTTTATDALSPREATERTRKRTLLQRVMSRPESASALGLVLTFAVFAYIAGDEGFLSWAGQATILNVAAQFGIVGATVTLLLIAGEFDLSVGSVVGLAGVVYAVAILNWGWPVWLAALVTMAMCGTIGLINGFLVVKTGMPSFIVTLAALFSVRGLALGFTESVAATPSVGGLRAYTENTLIGDVLAGRVVGNFRASILWWALLAIICAWVIARTRLGNWTFGVGGSNLAARELGVPIKRVKITLFVGSALAAGLLALIQVTEVGGADALRGTGKEFEAAITAVIGGTLLYGGYGTVIGTVLGALTLATVKQGLFFAGVDASWYQCVLGLVLLAAVLVNNSVLKRATGARQ